MFGDVRDAIGIFIASSNLDSQKKSGNRLSTSCCFYVWNRFTLSGRVFWKWSADLDIWPLSIRVTIIYLLHPIKKNCLKGTNVNKHCQLNADTNQSVDILKSAKPMHHVEEWTQKYVNILDPVNFHEDNNLIISRLTRMLVCWSGVSLLCH